MIALTGLNGKTIAVFGLGKSGMATLEALRNSGARILVGDDSADGRKKAEDAGFPTTDLTKANWTEIDSLVLSPGIPHTLPAPHPVAALAKQHKVEIVGDVEYLFRAMPEPTYIGITGTNGKSTTTALIAHILTNAKRVNEVGGNLGIPTLSFKPLDKNGVYVIEMSSFQCELTPSAAFDVVVWLNITPDHIDRHGDIAGYVAAKKMLLRPANKDGAGKKQVLVIGVDDEFSAAVADEAENAGNWRVIRISSQKILQNGISGVGATLYNNGDELFGIAKAPTLPGAHNWQNAAAALAATNAIGVDIGTINKAIHSYPGLPHRQQLIRVIDGIRFINDSKATNADATSKALGCYDAIYWIVGGKPKDGGLSGLEAYMPRIKHAFLIGYAAKDFAAWLKDKAPASISGTLEVAVRDAATMAAKSGDKNAVVLLSPACASYDQFNNYEHRGEEFARFVNAL
ncbi:MAG: UDP-N-acetylmuramoyl-L-alanine--D-glutamate ligase [Alphaproteobacteria bacterium]|nr:UDP-N-acetylmuramoyl-L-alanine--D-glutamate ligase [Alphaproteobacteria bacterium]